MKRTHWIWLVMACICLCGSTALQAFTLTGTVTDPNGFSTGRVPGADISVEPGGFSAVTDANGNFSISGLAPGVYQLNVSKTGYLGYNTDLNMPADDKNIVLSIDIDESEAPAGIYDFTVIVNTPDGAGADLLEGALVEINELGVSGLTDANGRVTFTIASGEYTVTTSLAGYTNYTMMLTLDTNKQVVHSLAPLEGEESPAPVTYALIGKVTDPDGTSNNGIEGVLLTAEPGGYTATTDENGNFAFPTLPAGTYTLSLEKPGYSAPSMDLRMDSDKRVVLSMSIGSVE